MLSIALWRPQLAAMHTTILRLSSQDWAVRGARHPKKKVNTPKNKGERRRRPDNKKTTPNNKNEPQNNIESAVSAWLRPPLDSQYLLAALDI